MSKRLTLRQLKFIQIYIETGNATKAAMTAYSCKNENTAAVLGHENLRKPKIACEIEKYRKKGGLSIEKAINAINDGFDAEKKGGGPLPPTVPDHNVRQRSANMTLKLGGCYPSRQQEVHHKHAHLHLEAIKEFSQLPFDELTEMMVQQFGTADVEKLFPQPGAPLQQEPEDVVPVPGQEPVEDPST